jgi:acyl carrier protein
MKQALHGDFSAQDGTSATESQPPEQAILTRMQEIVRDVIDDDSIVLQMGTTARDVAGWDSLTNIRIILAAEKAFAIKVSTTDTMSLRNVGDFVRLVASRKRP